MSLAEWYPIVIRESRYQGAYCGAQYVITVGLYPEHLEEIAAFGSDIPCMDYWNNVSKGGTFLEHDGREYFVMPGNDPSAMVEQAKNTIEQYVEENES